MSDSPVTLITGSSKGIGRYLAEHYLERGHRVVGCSRSGSGPEHANYTHHLADVQDEDGVRKIFQDVYQRYARLDNLLNNAGIAAMNHSLLTPMSSVRKILDTNVAGSFLCAREAARLMQRKAYGRIVNFTTVAVPLKLEGEAIYAASKAAVITLTEVLAREFAPMGITVNAIGPTPIETDLIAKVPKDKIKALIARQTLPRFGNFADVANVIDFYLKKESDFISGQTLFLGGL